MTWQGAGGPDGGRQPGEPDDATRTDWPTTEGTAAGAQPPAPDAQPPAAPAPQDMAPSGARPVPPPPMPPAGAPGAGAPVTPWAAPDQGGGWGTPVAAAGPYAVPGAPGLVYAGAIPRAAAYVVDGFILAIISAIVAAPFAARGITFSDPGELVARSGVSTLISTVVSAVYFILLWTTTGRATIGMRLFSLQIGRAADGGTLTYEQAGRRWLAYGTWLGLLGFAPALAALGGLLQFFWLLALLFTTVSSPTKQGLHDRFAGSAMVRPAAAGNGLAITCLLLALLLPLVLAFIFVSLVLVGGQMSTILSDIGTSI